MVVFDYETKMDYIDWNTHCKFEIMHKSYNADGYYFDCPVCKKKKKYFIRIPLERRACSLRCQSCKSEFGFFYKTCLKNNKVMVIVLFFAKYVMDKIYLKQTEIMKMFDVSNVTASRFRRVCKEMDNDNILMSLYFDNYDEIEWVIEKHHPDLWDLLKDIKEIYHFK